MPQERARPGLVTLPVCGGILVSGCAGRWLRRAGCPGGLRGSEQVAGTERPATGLSREAGPAPIGSEECGVWPSGVQPENGFLDVLVPSRSERLLGPYCLEAAFLKDAE
jgi:hypothetical protein